MITFRKNTSFPFLKVAREAGVPYEKVLRIADEIDSHDLIHHALNPTPLVVMVIKTMTEEYGRRADAKESV